MPHNSKMLFLKKILKLQQGQVLLVLLVLLTIGAGAAFYTLVRPASSALERDKITAAALAQAKAALIGYAATHASRPGTLPCPDITNDGQIDTPCNTAANRIGRLPWKTLGLPDLRDGAGERLWYAVSDVFKNSGITGIVNSDISGDFTVNGTTGVIAVIFSPGAITGAQQRDTANINNVSNYLDGGNESGGTTFTTSSSTNDKLLLITRENLFPTVEQRVIREIGRNLQLHYNNPGGGSNTNHRYYPYPAPFTGSTACDTTTPIYRGRIALSCSSPLSAVTLPPWFSSNRWNEVLVYSVAPKCAPRIISGSVDPASLDCNNTGGFLTVTGVSTSVEALLFSAGPGLGSQIRPACPSAADCLEDSQNTEMPDNYTYIRPLKSPSNNDSLFIVGPPGP